MTQEYVRSVELDDERSIGVRLVRPDDVDALVALYQRMSPLDRQRRFFSVVVPHPEVVETWVVMTGRPGALGLVADLIVKGQPTRLIGEAGCSPLPDGDAELGISIDPEYRGWFGSWLFDTLLEEAAAHGIANIQALIAVDNKQMRRVLCHRGAAAMPSQDYSTSRFTISTSGRTPSWPPNPDGKKRLLVESKRARWFGTPAAQQKGFDVIVCAGPTAKRGHCPVLEGGSCPLVDGADEVVVAIYDENERDPLHAAHSSDQTKPVHIQRADTTDAALEIVDQLADEDDGLP